MSIVTLDRFEQTNIYKNLYKIQMKNTTRRNGKDAKIKV